MRISKREIQRLGDLFHSLLIHYGRTDYPSEYHRLA